MSKKKKKPKANKSLMKQTESETGNSQQFKQGTWRQKRCIIEYTFGISVELKSKKQLKMLSTVFVSMQSSLF